MRSLFLFATSVFAYDYKQHGRDWEGTCQEGSYQSPMVLGKGELGPDKFLESVGRVLTELKSERDINAKFIDDAKKGDELMKKLDTTMLRAAESDLKVIVQSKIDDIESMKQAGADGKERGIEAHNHGSGKRVIHVDLVRENGGDEIKALRARLESVTKLQMDSSTTEEVVEEIPFTMLTKAEKELVRQTANILKHEEGSLTQDTLEMVYDPTLHSLRPSTLGDADATERFFQKHEFPLHNDDAAFQFFFPQKMRILNEPNSFVLRMPIDDINSGFGVGQLYTFPMELNVAHQVHFHAPAEHFLGGEDSRAALEMQIWFVNVSQKTPKVVWRAVSLLFHAPATDMPLKGSPSEVFLQTIIGHTKEKQISETESLASFAQPLAFNDLFLLQGMAGGKYHRYFGSQTAPDCKENVDWFVAQNPLPASAETLKQFVSMMEQLKDGNAAIGNFREAIEPSADREVKSAELNWVRVYFPDPGQETVWDRLALATKQVLVASGIVCALVLVVALIVSFSRRNKTEADEASKLLDE